MLQHLCSIFVGRAKTFGLKGKKRDEALIEFMCGAYYALDHAGLDKEAGIVGATTLMVFPVRGFAECGRIANALAPAAKAEGTKPPYDEVFDALAELRAAVYPYEDDDVLDAAKVRADAILGVEEF